MNVFVIFISIIYCTWPRNDLQVGIEFLNERGFPCYNPIDPNRGFIIHTYINAAYVSSHDENRMYRRALRAILLTHVILFRMRICCVLLIHIEYTSVSEAKV